jgi:hypothetical protein
MLPIMNRVRFTGKLGYASYIDTISTMFNGLVPSSIQTVFANDIVIIQHVAWSNCTSRSTGSQYANFHTSHARLCSYLFLS